jgi:hypothetical protein
MMSGSRRPNPLACVSTCIGAFVLAACSPKSDSARAIDQRRSETERAARDMRTATLETSRGKNLVGDDLVAAVLGKTLVDRYGTRPDGKAGAYVMQRYFADGGRFVMTDSPPFESPMASERDRWRVEHDQLCIQGPPQPEIWKCYRLARTNDGALQAFIADPGSPYDGLLTVVTREIVEGPPSASTRSGETPRD